MGALFAALWGPDGPLTNSVLEGKADRPVRARTSEFDRNGPATNKFHSYRQLATFDCGLMNFKDESDGVSGGHGVQRRGIRNVGPPPYSAPKAIRQFNVLRREAVAGRPPVVVACLGGWRAEHLGLTGGQCRGRPAGHAH
jgi:hypothetical protein